MVRLLKRLEKEEEELHAQNEILAREAMLCGFDPVRLEPPAPKRRKSSVAKQKSTTAATSGPESGAETAATANN